MPTPLYTNRRTRVTNPRGVKGIFSGGEVPIFYALLHFCELKAFPSPLPRDSAPFVILLSEIIIQSIQFITNKIFVAICVF